MMSKTLGHGLTAALLALLLAACNGPVSGSASQTATESGGQGPAQMAASAETREIRFSVPDMSCPMCPITVSKALTRTDGVLEAEVIFGNKTARVVYDPARVSVDDLVEAIAKTGYTAAPVAGEDADGAVSKHE
ncbi:MAG: hypothetical protein Kow0020_02500 [Wenzhouxiangellaceae bacterium]